MALKYRENKLHNFLKNKKLKKFYEKKNEDSSFNIDKKIIWATHYPTQTKPELRGFTQTHPLI